MKLNYLFLTLTFTLTLVFVSSSLPSRCQIPDLNKADDPLVEVKFPNSRIDDILATYEIYTGKRLIRDANLSANSASLQIVSAKPLPKSEAIRFIEAGLLLNGFTITPGPDGALKVINAASGKIPRSEGMPIYANAADLPPGDQLVSFYLPLHYIPSIQAQAAFTNQAPPHPYGAYVEIPHTQALILTENTSVIRQLLALAELIDVPPVQLVNVSITLKRADAEKVADAINKMLDASKKGQAPSPGSLMPPNAPAQLESQLVAGDVQVIPDPRTNSILLITRPTNLSFLKSLVEQFDEATDLIKPLQRSLNYITVGQPLLDVIQSLLTDTKDDAGKSGSGTSAPTQTKPPTQNSSPSNGTSAGGSGPSSLNAQLGAAPVTDPLSIVVGKTKVIGDVATNSIIVVGPPESIDRVNALLDKMDRKPMQVYLATVVGQLDLTHDSELSVDLLQNFAHISGDFGVASSSLNSTALATKLDPTSLTSAAVFPAIAGGNIYGAVGQTLNYYVKALQSTGRFSVLSRPSVYTANNQKASISSGLNIPIAQNNQSTADVTGNNSVSLNSTVAYQPVQLLLEVIPLINEKKEINLQISQQNNNISGNSTISGNSYPIVASESLQTTITIPNNATLVLGGLIRDTDSATRSGFPFLSDIPLLGAFFRSDVKTKQREELVIMIQPQVIETDEELAALQGSEKRREAIGNQILNYDRNTPSSVNTKGKVPGKFP